MLGPKSHRHPVPGDNPMRADLEKLGVRFVDINSSVATLGALVKVSPELEQLVRGRARRFARLMVLATVALVCLAAYTAR